MKLQGTFEPTDCVLIMGQRRCGKSYLAKKVQDIWPRRLIIDTLNEYRDEGEIVRTFKQFSEKLIELKAQNSRKFVIIFQFPVESKQFEAEFNEIMRLAYYFGDLQIVIEEIQLHCHPTWLPHWLKNNLLIGRHQKISLLFTSQRPGEVNKTIVSQCNHIFVGKLIDRNDLNYVSTFLNQDAEKLINLPERQFLYFCNGNIQQISNDI